MSKPFSTLTFTLAVLAGLYAVGAHGADALATAPDPCVGSVAAQAAARPRMTLHPVQLTPESRVALSWEPVAGATEYRIFREPRCPAQSRTQVAVVRGDVRTWTDPNKPAVAWYSVETTQDKGTGLARLSNPVLFYAAKAPANPAAASPAPAPAAQGNSGGGASGPQAPKYAPMKLFSVKATPDGPLLTWEAVAGAREYRIEREFPGVGRAEQVATTPGNMTQWTDKGQTARAMYMVKSVPSDSRQPMGASNAIEFVPGVAPARPLGLPGAPALLKPLVAPPAGVAPATPPAPTGVAGPAPSATSATPNPPMSSGPTDTVERRFALDGRPPQRESVGFGLTSVGTVQVSIQWKGGPLTVSLRPSNGSAIDSKNVSGGNASVSFAVNPAQVAQSLGWVVEVGNPGSADGLIRVTSPRPDAARMNAAIADAKARAEQQRQQIMNQPPAAQNQAAQMALARLQKEKADAAAASHQRIRAAQQQRLSAPARLALAAPAPLRAEKFSLGLGRARTPAALKTPPGTMLGGDLSDVPYASAMAPQAVFPNTTLTVDGMHFKADDEVWFILPSGEVKSQKTYVSATRILLQMPAYSLTSPQDAYLYFKYQRNGSTLRTDDAFAFQLQPTTPVIQGVALADPNDPDTAIRPGKVVMLSGTGFAPDAKVFFMLQNKEFEAAHYDSSFNSTTQLLVTLPSTVPPLPTGAPPAQLPQRYPFATVQQVPFYVKNGANAIASNRLNVALAPELEVVRLDLGRFSAEFDRDSRLNPARAAVVQPGNALISGSFSQTLFLGFKGDDEYFVNTQLANGWVVRSVDVQKTHVIHEAANDVYLADARVGTSSLYAKVHKWVEVSFPYVTDVFFSVTYIVQGPKGMPYK